MGYSLIVGEKIIENEDGYERVWAREENFLEAPAFGEPTDYTNKRWPSYSAWSAFVEAVKLKHVLFEKNGIRGGHPGYFVIDQNFYDEIVIAKHNYEKTFPNVQPTFNSENEEDMWYCRLVWLASWVKWALDNCHEPIFANS